MTGAKTSRIAVVIPALNEEASIGRVIHAIPRKFDGGVVSTVVVVNNGSTDATASVASAAGAAILDEPRRGYGQACLTGLSFLRKAPPEIVVFLDGDFSDSPEELPRVVAPILCNDLDLVIGSRVKGNREPGALLPQARFGNWLSCTLIKQLYGVEFSDLGPFRAIRWTSLERLSMLDRNFGWTVEMQIRAAKRGLRCGEVAVSYKKRIGKSKVSGTLYGSFMAGQIILTTIFKEKWLED